MIAGFELPPDYRPNPVRSVAAGSGPYWTPDRVALSCKYQYAVYRRARRLAAERRTRSILDIGCGTATKLAALFGGITVHGIDSAEAIAVAARTLPAGHFVAADLDGEQLDLGALVPRCTRELVICADVIEHLLYPDRLLDSIRGFATSDTRVVLSTPDRHRLLGTSARQPSVPDHVREWSASELRRLVERSGFEVLEHEVQLPFSFGPDRMTARYLVDRVRRRLPLRSNQVVVCAIR